MQQHVRIKLSIFVFIAAIATATILSGGVRAEAPAPTVKALKIEKPFQVVILQGGSAAPWKKGRDVKFRKTIADFNKKIAAATVFASLYGQSPIGNPYDYLGKVGKDDLAFLQKVADDTVKKFYGR